MPYLCWFFFPDLRKIPDLVTKGVTKGVGVIWFFGGG